MREPLYGWQAVNIRGTPLLDMAEEEFNQRLEELVQELEDVQQGEAVWPSESV